MAEQSARTCLYFGTFNPIHTGHLMIAQSTLRQFGPALGFNTVTFIPAGTPPHRQQEHDLLDARRRLQMVQLAVADHPAFRVSDIEMQRSGRSYTVDTLRLLLKQGLVSAPIPFIIGADAFQGLASWHEPQALIEWVHFLLAPRPDCLPVEALHLGKHGEPQATLTTSAIDMPMLAISSTWIRQILRESPHGAESLHYFLPERVRAFISDNGLYA